MDDRVAQANLTISTLQAEKPVLEENQQNILQNGKTVESLNVQIKTLQQQNSMQDLTVESKTATIEDLNTIGNMMFEQQAHIHKITPD